MDERERITEDPTQKVDAEVSEVTAAEPADVPVEAAGAGHDSPVPKADMTPEISIDDDDASDVWVPSRFEKRVHAIPEKRWELYQLLGGIAIGVFTIAALFFGGTGASPMMIAALVLTLFVPSLLEDRGRRKLTRLRFVMIVVILVGLIVMMIYTGATKGWQFFTTKS
ncbi:MAG: hypothetical protein IJJ45_03625 [Clostridia bacterium]|nr:hypothetical protein [Clostridia bacterium]